MLAETEAEISRIARGLAPGCRIAVLGIKPESHRGQPAHDVPAYLQASGIKIVPVPTYYPDVTTILGEPVFRRVRDTGVVNCVNVFRRSQDLAAHLDDLVAAKPKVVWLQSGIRGEPVWIAALSAAGIEVVQDRCLMVDHHQAWR